MISLQPFDIFLATLAIAISGYYLFGHTLTKGGKTRTTPQVHPALERLQEMSASSARSASNRARPTKPMFIALRPGDDGRDLPRAIFQHPDNFIPEKDPDGRSRAWGIYARNFTDDEIGEEMQRKVMRRFKDQSQYNSNGPEAQFVTALIERKIKVLEQVSLGDLKKSDYVLKVSLKFDGNDDGPAFNIWRRVRLSGGLSLAILADKILTPLMGWTRNYHAHTFTDLRDGSLFGPKDCGTTDMMHMMWLGYKYVPENRWKVAHLLREHGDLIEWRYDLGDQWMHDVQVESIVPRTESTGKVVVLDGFGACPAEDCQGAASWSEIIRHVRSGTPNQKAEALTKIRGSMNYNGKGVIVNRTFDFNRFSVDEGTAAVKDALSLPGSFRCGPRQISMPIVPGGPTIGDLDAARWKKKKQNAMKTDLGDGVYLEESTTGKRDGVSARACSNCGTPHGLSLDTRCRAVYYCGSECQLEHWATRHKKDCKRLAKTGIDTLGSTN